MTSDGNLIQEGDLHVGKQCKGQRGIQPSLSLLRNISEFVLCTGTHVAICGHTNKFNIIISLAVEA